jgi:polyhydroxyalkanoate synthesis regulator phasin
MSIEHHQTLLADISSVNQDVMAAAANVQEYTEMLKAGQISKEEYADLIEDIQRQINIQSSMAELHNMEKLNTAINGLINIARIV